MAQFYLADGDNRKGPFSAEQLPSQGLTADSLVWREGMADWQPASAVPELRPFLPAQPQPQFQQQYQGQQYQQQPPFNQYQQQGYQTLQYSGGAVGEPGPGFGITAMVLGILSLLLFWAWCAGIPLGILAVIFGAVGAKRVQGKGMAVAGLVCGMITIGLAVIVLIIWGSILASM